jgi:hypothetical protein
MKAIRKFCLDCAGSHVGVRSCDDRTCDLWRYRFGMGLNRYQKKKRWENSKKTHFALLKKKGGNYGA